MTIALPPAAFRPAPDLPVLGTTWRRHLAALGGVAVLLLAAFWGDVETLTHLWWTSTTFGHCLFIGPVLAWLVWQRRGGLAKLTPVAWWPGLCLAALGGASWLVGDAAGVALARQLGLVMLLQGAVVTLLGPNVARALLFPLAYAFFLVPFGESMEGPLQTVTVSITMHLLHAIGLDAVNDGVLITLGPATFEVAEACSGAKFVIAMIAYGTLVANVCYVSWTRRIAFMAMALAMPVLANGVRAFGTIWLAHLTSVEAATGFDHIVYGWVFFGLVMAGVLAIGWRWFDRDLDADWFDVAALSGPVRLPLALAPAVALVLAVAAVFPSWSAAIAARAEPVAVALPRVPGWTRVGPGEARAAWSPTYPGADARVQARYVDARGRAVNLAVAVYGSQRDGKELVGFGIGVLHEDDRWVRVEDLDDIAGGSAMRITADGVQRVVATWYALGGRTTASEKMVKLETLKAKLLGGPQRGAAVHVSALQTPEGDASQAIADFVTAAGGVERLAGL